VSDKDDTGPVEAVRVGPGQFLLAAERIEMGLTFATAGQTFEIVSRPVDVGSGRFLATVNLVAGPGAGRQLTVQVQVGPRVG
jgi:sarcosine oxidase gamma subunit